MRALHVVVTGAAGGIGYGLVQGFLGDGWLVTGIDIKPGHEAEGYRHLLADVTDEAALEVAFDEAWAQRAVTAVIANAAVTDIEHRFATEIPYDAWRRVLRVNVDGAFLTARLAARRMAAQGGGNIVFVTSSLAFLPEAKAGDAPYCTSKAAVEMLARVLALELAAHGVNVNTLYPSVKIDTGFFSHLPADERATLARPDLLNAPAMHLASLTPGRLSGRSIDQDRWDRDAAYRAELGEASGGGRS